MATGKKTLGISVGKSENFPEWYQQVVTKAELADYTSVSGCIVFRPCSYAIWEKLQGVLDKRFKGTGVKNVYFPLFIPEGLFKKEAEHVEGFQPEVAWVTQAGSEKLAERLAIRPTSETIMYDTFAKWVQSWRDLPLLVNQWCSVVRWEFKYPKPFLRTREFLWQEGHTVHETKQEADEWVMKILSIYQETVEEYLAIPVLVGTKSEKEKFAGAHYTTTMEALMPDGRALQMGTSHNLGQGFAEAFGISFQGKDGTVQVPWQTSWGVSTRTIGALIMSHGDDYGLVLPPKIAPVQVVIVPIIFEDSKKEVLAAAEKLRRQLAKAQVLVEVDDRESYTAGWKFNEWELKGVPVRMEIGPKDVAKKQAVLFRRDTRQKATVSFAKASEEAKQLLETIQQALLQKAKKHLKENIAAAKTVQEVAAAVKVRKLAQAYFCGSAQCEEKLKEKADGASSRCMSFNTKNKGSCIICNGPGPEAWMGKAY